MWIFELCPENVDFVQKLLSTKTQNRKYLENYALDEIFDISFVKLVERNPTVLVSGRYDQ